LLEFSATIPSTLKLRKGRSKHLLRKLLERYVPAPIVNRPKQGFAAPVGEWLRGPLSTMVNELLQDGRMRDRGIFEPSTVRRLWSEHRTKQHDHTHRLWSLVMLELWFRRYVDGALRPERTRAAA